MSQPSNWPLPPQGVRFHVPEVILRRYESNPLCHDLYPLRFGFYPHASGHSMQREQHDDYLLIYCIDGAARLSTPTQHYQVQKGDLAILPKGTTHRYQADHHDPWTIFWVHFEGRLAAEFLDNLGTPANSNIVHLGVLPSLVAYFEALLAVQKTGFSDRIFIHAAQQLRQLLSYLAVQMPAVKARQFPGMNLDHIHALMLQRLHGQLELNELAASVNLSRFYFAKKYKQLTGHSPIEQFIHLKMEHACYLLDVSDRQISAIARELGYEDPYYFSRLFRKVIGLSPREYQRVRYR
ncbi:MAG: AraC family transcriptional regulator [Hahellaceae bacterium]|nr:AraC family transcriptional regulator [Hahellaceae bacterium]MCP5169243.1 AraC family transcriptional regulator [Hahellaceae bacterium]